MKRVSKPARGKLVSRVKQLTSTQVKVGYFADQGIHPEAHMSYPDLMYLQEVTGVQSKGGKVHRRVFELTMNLEGQRLRNKLLTNLKRSFVRGNIDSAKESFGRDAKEAISGNFGNLSMLPENAPSTRKRKGFNSPLIETSDLQEKLTYRLVSRGK